MTRNQRINRRTFLTAASTATAGLAVPYIWVKKAQATEYTALQTGAFQPGPEELTFIQPQPVRLKQWGRTTTTTAIRENVGLNQPVVEWLHPNIVLPLLEEIEAEGSNPNNKLWYRVDGGYVYTSTIQPMEPYRMPVEIDELTTTIEEEPGAWAEIIVPYTVARVEPSGLAARTDNDDAVVHYYGSVHRIMDIEYDGAGYRWYKVYDDKPKTEPVYVLGRHMRIFDPQSFTPIHPGANKKLVADLTAQRIDCYEDDQVVYSTLMSSGGAGFGTPRGEHAVVYKQPSRHMYSDPEQEAFSDPDFFDLPGVPFNIFFTTLGHAIHGTYWHGDYGRPRSHGCLNVTPKAALWLFRWLEPESPYTAESAGSVSDPGTPVIVV